MSAASLTVTLSGLKSITLKVMKSDGNVPLPIKPENSEPDWLKYCPKVIIQLFIAFLFFYFKIL